MQNRNFKIFVDFDGTISQKDIGEEMFLQFGDAEKANDIAQKWMNFSIKAVDAWKETCDTVKNFEHQDFDLFLNEIEIDNGFKNFVQWCSYNNCDLKILSDGFDYYIHKFLKREELNHIDCRCNNLSFGLENKLIPQFPFTDEECTKCANCKRNHILNLTSDEDYTVYVGDGFTDFCPAQYCDFIFAKKSLLKYCEKNRITFYPYNNFNDVIKKLDELKEKKRLKKRYQAELKRKELYISG